MKYVTDNKFLLDTLTELVKIDSRNPSLSLDAPGELECAKFVYNVLKELGLTVKIHEIAPNRANVVGVIKGRGSGKTLLLNAHLDTVGTDGMDNPFNPFVKDGMLYGRGSCDMKGSLAAIITVAKTLIDNEIKLDGDLIIAAVADEEYTSIGSLDLVKNYSADAAIVTEFTDLELVRAHRGYIWYDIETLGRAAHGSDREWGIDANMHMGRFLFELDKLEKRLQSQPRHSLVGTPTLHASILKGGTDISTYSAKCNLKVERRTVPGEQEPKITKELQDIADKLSSEDKDFKATVKPFIRRPYFETDKNAEIVRTAEEVLDGYFNKKCEHKGVGLWADSAIFSGAGIETILLGPSGEGAHENRECVNIQSLNDLTKIIVEIVLLYCN